MIADKIGNALRQYYSTFGEPEEGPPEDCNVTSMFPSTDFTKDILLINKVCDNPDTLKKYNECKELIQYVANSLGNSNFMDELNDSVANCDSSEKEHLTNGIFWHYLASILDPKIGKDLNVPISIPGDLPEIKQELLKVQGSLIFRLYITLVYMKEGPINQLLTQAAMDGKPISKKVKMLLNCDYVRHLRNALSHSTIESTSFGIYFNDYNKFETVASPGFLNSLASWIMLINLQCSTVIDQK